MLFYEDVLEEVKAYVDQELAGKARYFDINELFPERFFGHLSEDIKLFDLLLTADDPERGLRTFLEAVRLIATEFASLASLVAAQGIYGIWALKTFGSPEQQEKLLPLWQTGQSLAAFAFSENQLDLAKRLPETVARQTATGWALTGYKHMVSNVGLAKYFLVLAQTVDLYGEKGTGIFLVPADQPGVTLEPQVDKLGLRAMPLAPIRFEAVNLPETALLGGELAGLAQYEAIMVQMRLTISAQSLGLAQGVFAKGLADSKIKRGFGKRPIDVPLNQFKLADMASQLAACQSYYEAHIRGQMTDSHQVSLLKLMTARLAQEVAEEMVRLTGAYSFVADNDIERYVRDAQVVANYGGSLDSLKGQVAAIWLTDE